MARLLSSGWAYPALIVAAFIIGAPFAILESDKRLFDPSNKEFWASYLSGVATFLAVVVAVGAEFRAGKLREADRQEVLREALGHTRSATETLLESLELIKFRLYQFGREGAPREVIVASLAFASETASLCRDAPIGKLSAEQTRAFMQIRILLSDLVSFVQLNLNSPGARIYELSRAITKSHLLQAISHATKLGVSPHPALWVQYEIPGPPPRSAWCPDARAAITFMKTADFSPDGVKWLRLFRSIDESLVAEWNDDKSCWLIYVNDPVLAGLPQRHLLPMPAEFLSPHATTAPEGHYPPVFR